MNQKKFNVKSERFYSVHYALLRIAKDNLERAEAKENGWVDRQFAAIALSSLAIEAICNAVGEKIIDNWSDFESCSPIAKTRLICEHLDIDYDAGKEPWGSLIRLCKTRNLIAHAKAESIMHEAVITEQERNNEKFKNGPQSKLEEIMTLDNARKSIVVVDNLIDLFCDKLTPEQNFGISGDMWHSSLRVQDNTT